MINCKDCKHWNKCVDYRNWGQCNQIISKIDVSEDGVALNPDCYETRADFGCVMGEKK